MLTDNILTQVFSKLNYDSEMEKLQKKYSLNLTTSAVSSTNPQFPTLVLQMLESSEIGQDLDNTTINGINAGFQIDVIDNQKTRTRLNEIINATIAIMKSMRFNIRMMPNQDTSDEKRSILRATRVIGSGDTL